jgi:prepilin-type N-terminal cleavage/methylation domain-containing protein/prepilin-type processing-associated H-X9-DG protein
MRRLRPGFTFIELIVVISIIGVLLGLLMPAVQKVREAAVRVECANNLKQIGVGFMNYHDANGCFPPGYLATDSYPSTSPGWGWGALLLPYIEQDPLYKQFDLTKPVETSPAIQSIVPLYLCPADLVPRTPFTVTDATFTPITLAAPSSYAASVGDNSSDVADPRGNGVFYRNSHTRLTDIKDGTTSTTLAGDRAWCQTLGIWAGAPNGAIARAGTRNPWPNATGPSPALILVHNNWINITTDADGGLDDFSSNHSWGVNILMADGSVHFIRDIVSDGPTHRAFWGMGTRAGGEVIDGYIEY